MGIDLQGNRTDLPPKEIEVDGVNYVLEQELAELKVQCKELQENREMFIAKYYSLKQLALVVLERAEECCDHSEEITNLREFMDEQAIKEE